MKGVNFPESNLTLTAPKGQEDTVYDLHVFRFHYSDETPAVISCWKMSWRERIAALFTGRVWLLAHGVTHPPVRLDGVRPLELPPVKGHLHRMACRLQRWRA